MSANEGSKVILIGFKKISGALITMSAAFFCNLLFFTSTNALFTPSLSTAVENNSAVDGKLPIHSVNHLNEYSSVLKVEANLKAGYSVSMSTETNDTALSNPSGVRIESISSETAPTGILSNSWGYKLSSDSNYRPIPALSHPETIINTSGRIHGEQNYEINLGVFADSTLVSGDYTNKIIFSVVANPYDKSAVMMPGSDFYNLFDQHEELGYRGYQHFKEASSLPDPSVKTFDIDEADSDYAIKMWYDENDDMTLYFYTTADKIYLNPDSSQLFKDANSAADLDLSKFDTSLVTDMTEMFNNVYTLSSLDLSHFDTRNVTSMKDIFNNDNALTDLNISSFNTSKVKDMSGMFTYCYGLTSIDVSNFDTSKVESMQSMFSGLSELTELNITNFDTSSVTNMHEMFGGLAQLTELDVSHLDTSNVTDMSGMFTDVGQITELNLSNFNTSKVENMSGMFSGMAAVTELDLSHFDTSAVTDMSSMFLGMSSLTNLNTHGFDTHNVTDMGGLFSQVSALDAIDISHFDTSSVEDMSNMFSGASSLTHINLGNNFNTEKVKNMSGMFKNATSLGQIDLTHFNTQNVTDMSSMFNNATALTELNLTLFDTRNVENMEKMFAGLQLTDLNLAAINTAKVTNMKEMFSGMNQLAHLDLSSFETNNLKEMSAMFQGMTALEELDILHFNTSQVDNMKNLFKDVAKVTKLDLTNFNSRKATDMTSMFDGMEALSDLKLGPDFSFEMANNLDYMFHNTYSLKSIDLGEVDIQKTFSLAGMFAIDDPSRDQLEKIYTTNEFKLTEYKHWQDNFNDKIKDEVPGDSIKDVFKNRLKLRGGQGFHLPDPSKAVRKWFCNDNPPSAPGYFTKKP